jgi:hypothetical protein
MADDAPTLTDTDVMAAFVQQHGDAPGEESAPSVSKTPEPKAEATPLPGTEEGEASVDALDPATLQALGLAPEESAPPSAQSADGDAQGTEEVTIDLASLANTFGLDESAFVADAQGVRVKTKVDGEEQEVSLGDLRRGYQLQSHFTRQQEAFLQEKQAWEQAQQQQEASLQQQAALAAEILTAEETQLNAAYTKDWDSLRKEDPVEYTAQVAEYNQALADIRNRRQRLDAAMQQRQQKMNAKVQQHMLNEANVLADKMGWKDQKSWDEGITRVREYLIQHEGVPAETVDAFADHRAYILAEKARLYDELKAKIATSRKKVSTANRVPAGGKPPAEKSARKTKQIEEAQKHLRKTGSVRDAANVFDKLGVI